MDDLQALSPVLLAHEIYLNIKPVAMTKFKTLPFPFPRRLLFSLLLFFSSYFCHIKYPHFFKNSFTSTKDMVHMGIIPPMLVQCMIECLVES